MMWRVLAGTWGRAMTSVATFVAIVVWSASPSPQQFVSYFIQKLAIFVAGFVATVLYALPWDVGTDGFQAIYNEVICPPTPGCPPVSNLFDLGNVFIRAALVNTKSLVHMGIVCAICASWIGLVVWRTGRFGEGTQSSHRRRRRRKRSRRRTEDE